MTTISATNPLFELVDQLSEHAAAVHAVLQKEIAEIGPSDPDDQPEFDILREYFAENVKEIENRLEYQVLLVENLLELIECEPAVLEEDESSEQEARRQFDEAIEQGVADGTWTVTDDCEATQRGNHARRVASRLT
jgi:hypothetical protein